VYLGLGYNTLKVRIGHLTLMGSLKDLLRAGIGPNQHSL